MRNAQGLRVEQYETIPGQRIPLQAQLRNIAADEIGHVGQSHGARFKDALSCGPLAWNEVSIDLLIAQIG